MANETVVTEAEHKSKLEEQAKAKGELSYSYWASSTGNVETVAPRKLTEEEAAAVAEAERKASCVGASAWNQAGTFEERAVTPWARERVTQLLKGSTYNGINIYDVNGVTGDANIFIVRGKKRCGFDFELQLAWKSQLGGDSEIRGQLKVLGFNSDDPDEMHLTPELVGQQAGKGADEARAMKAVQGLVPQLQQVLGQLLDELKAK